LGAKAQEAPVNDLKSKILSSLSPIEVPNLIHSELKSSEKLGFDHINRKYFTTDLDGVHVKDQMLTVQEQQSMDNSVMLSFYDQAGQLISSSNVSDIISPKVGLDAENSSSSGKGSIPGSQVESKLQNLPSVWSFEDNMSILRFKASVQGP
jgi:hypothetical protein